MPIDKEKLSKILQVNYAKGVEDQGPGDMRSGLKRKRKKKKKDDEFKDDGIAIPSSTHGSY